MDRSAFYAALRSRNSGVFGTSLSSSQVSGIEGILDGFLTHGDGRAKTLAYALATTVRETGSRMVPVREGFATSDASARRIVAKKAYGKPAGPYGQVYYGRGRVQETWLENYEKTAKETGVDIVQFPDRRLEPVLDAQILFAGLLDGRWNGQGKGIAFYLPTNGPDDLKNARRTVNITDHWEEIAGYYQAFMKAIAVAGGGPTAALVAQPAPPVMTQAPPAPPPAAPPITYPEPTPTTGTKTVERNWLWRLLFAVVGAISKRK